MRFKDLTVLGGVSIIHTHPTRPFHWLEELQKMIWDLTFRDTHVNKYTEVQDETVYL
jgi:hypothetical protein